MTFWLNGEWREDLTAIHIDDRGLLLGDGVFETIFLRAGEPAFLGRHIKRLSQGLNALGIDVSMPESLRDIIRKLTVKNDLGESDASLRLTVTRGSGPRGLAPPPAASSSATILMTCAPARVNKTDIRKLIVSRRLRGSGVAAQFKTLGYLENALALNDASAAGADDALMLSANGHIACASAANLFAIAPEGVVLTPPLSDGALAGVVRGVLIDAAERAGVSIAERSISPANLAGCALFLTNSLIGLAPASLPGSADTRTNEIFKRLDACYQDALERDLRQAAP